MICFNSFQELLFNIWTEYDMIFLYNIISKKVNLDRPPPLVL